MNREIKFRGRIVNSKEWAYGSLVVYPDGEYNVLAPRNGHSPKMDDWLVEVDTIGQSTGLYDKSELLRKEVSNEVRTEKA